MIKRILTVGTAAGLLWAIALAGPAVAGDKGKHKDPFKPICKGDTPAIVVKLHHVLWQIVEIGTGETIARKGDGKLVELEPGHSYEFVVWPHGPKHPYKVLPPIEVPGDACQPDDGKNGKDGKDGKNGNGKNGRDLNCEDFDSQAEAQAKLDRDPSDPHGLDGDGDGIACEAGPTPTPTPVSEVKGDSLPFTGSPLALLGLIAAALIAAGGVILGGTKLLARRY